jgi:predicted nucleic-acid-binding Zn-ribbon protein
MSATFANVGYFVDPFTATVAKTTAAESDTIFAAANVWSAGCAAGNHTAAETAEKVYTTETTCEVDGKYNEVVMCQFCDEVFSTSEEKTEAALGHDMVETEAEVAATCEVAGKTAVKECSRCDATEGGDEIPAPGHKYIETVRRAATCYSVGDLRITCENCSYNEKREIPKTDHVLEDVPGVEPTCTTAGREPGTKCKNNCPGVGETGAEIPAKGHTETNVVVVAPTYQDKGYTEFYCPDCDKTLKKDFTDKLNANFTLTIKAPEATTVANGNTVVLEAEVAGGDYTGLSIVWTVVEGEGIFETVQTEDGKFEITASGNGEATFTAELVDAEGNKYGSDSIKMTAEPDMLTQIKLYITSLWDKLLALIMSLIMG